MGYRAICKPSLASSAPKSIYKAREVLILLLVSVILLTSFPAAAASIGKPGTHCKTKNQIASYQGTRVKCLLVKGRLQWQRLKVISPPIRLPQIEDPAITAKKKVLFEALAEIRAYRALAESPSVEFESVIEPGFDETSSKSFLTSQHWAQEQWGQALANVVKPRAIMANSADFIFLSLRSWGATENWIQRRSDFINRAYPPGGVTRYPLWAFSDLLNNDPRFPIIVYMSYPAYVPKPGINVNSVHEIFHAVQRSLDPSLGNLPCWIIEGQASLFGLAYSADGRPEQDLMTVAKYGGFPKPETGLDLARIESPSGWQFGQAPPCGDLGEYSQGLVANALLVHRFGVQKSFDFLREMKGQPGNATAWRVVFERVFGVSVPDFYLEARDYMKWYFMYYFGQSL